MQAQEIEKSVRPQCMIIYLMLQLKIIGNYAQKQNLYYMFHITDATGNQCLLFNFTDTLLHNNSALFLPHHDSPEALANELATFFVEKIRLNHRFLICLIPSVLMSSFRNLQLHPLYHHSPHLLTIRSLSLSRAPLQNHIP